MDNNHFKSVFAVLCESFSKEGTQILAKVYWGKFKHLTNNDFSLAVDKAIGEMVYFPKVSELLRYCPPPMALENKESLSWCDNTKKLLAEYGTNTTPIAGEDAA